MAISATQLLCPKSPPLTHHLIPHMTRRGTEVTSVLTCTYCGKTDKEIRDEHERGRGDAALQGGRS